MGLDQYLYAHKHLSRSHDGENATYEAITKALNVEDIAKNVEFPFATIGIEVMYWRKANQIHKWFVDNVQDGEDDCREYDVSRESLATLLDLCEQVQADHDEAHELLPSESGFFFGSTDYDEWYFADIDRTIIALKDILNNTALHGWWFTYRASW